MKAYRPQSALRTLAEIPDSMTIGLRLIRRRRLADACMLDRLWDMARLPTGGLDMPALRESVARMFPGATPRQITLALAYATDQLAQRPCVGVDVWRARAAA